MSAAGTNTAPAVNSHMLVQLLLSIGLPMLILPIIATIAYFGFRRIKAKKNQQKDIEQGDCVKSSDCASSDTDSEETKFVMTPALATNSVQMPVRSSPATPVSCNF